jgi:8-oxo-dGTP pyrophosphatase MutT (NUDIX family)
VIKHSKGVEKEFFLEKFAMSEKNPWKMVSTRLVYENSWMRVREDQVVTPQGSPGIYSVVEARLAVGVIALTDDQQVYLVGQYRYPTDQYSWEIPEGGGEMGEEALTTAQRELLEETGVEASCWEELGGEVHTSNCFTAERGVLFLAQGLSVGESEPDETEQLKVKKVPLVDAIAMVDAGEIQDGLSIIALLRLARKLGV